MGYNGYLFLDSKRMEIDGKKVFVQIYENDPILNSHEDSVLIYQFVSQREYNSVESSITIDVQSIVEMLKEQIDDNEYQYKGALRNKLEVLLEKAKEIGEFPNGVMTFFMI